MSTSVHKVINDPNQKKQFWGNFGVVPVPLSDPISNPVTSDAETSGEDAPENNDDPVPNSDDPIPNSDDSVPNSDDGSGRNDVESLRKGKLKSNNKAQGPYTILLVGETGVGKSSVLEFIANVLLGNDIDNYEFDILDHENEAGGSDQESQTNSARLYRLCSNGGMEVHILDTPGLADTRGLRQDEVHKKSIATEIQKNIDSVNAVLILANGTVPRITVGTDYALSTLSAIFPKSLALNIAFIFTNVSSPLEWNFAQDSIPAVLRDAPQYLLNNPIALQKKFLKLKDDPNRERIMGEMHKAVEAGQQKALEMLVDLFDWVDTCKPQPTREILSLFEKSQEIEAKIANTLAQVDQATKKKGEIDRLMGQLKKDSADMDAFSKFQMTVENPVWTQKPTTEHNTLCNQTNCYSTCHEDCALNFTLDPTGLTRCVAMDGEKCRECGHALQDHQHYRVKWVETLDEQVVVNPEMKKDWENAKDGKGRNEILLANYKEALNGYRQRIDEATQGLAQLAEDYSDLSLSGSFSAQVEKAVRLLQQSYEGMEEKGVGEEQLQKMKDALDVMKKKLDVLKEANRKGKTESFWVGRVARLIGWK